MTNHHKIRKQLRGIQTPVDDRLNETVSLELSGEVWNKLMAASPPLPVWTWRDERRGVWHRLNSILRRF